MATKNLRQLQAEKTKETIQATIEVMVQERPISQLTIREICKKAGISPGAFYHHFVSKEAAILYCYRFVDQQFDNLKRNGTPLENIRSIINTHLGMLSKDNIETSKSVYISHLIYYDAYFFDENRPIFQVLSQEIAAYTGLHQESEKLQGLVWRMLRFCRGLMYNACIDPNVMMDTWPVTVVEEALQYFLFSVDSNSDL